ncbi:hypothetical protein [Reyranella soli]|uniref:Uncharacterized protein n=1 Tax=Reyranella soli TaxID=1230389 RepID=A0A512NQS6_9HYPH|nr:hypothetical protein [Reyranella soli]GEP61297.1 hypothetical protein RSO01_84630 [Reyranella soli]
MTNLTSRLDRLEEVMDPKRSIVVWQNHGEAAEAAIARWSAARPGEPELNPNNVQLIGWEAPQ